MRIVLRGHRDDSQYHLEIGKISTTVGVGNFINIINYALKNAKKVLENHLTTRSKCETYISTSTKNDLLICCCQVVAESILREIKTIKFCTMILDKATDISNKEQLSFCPRFVAKKDKIREDFLKFSHCDDGVTDNDLFKAVANTLKEFGLDLKNCRGQEYDGAGGMAEQVNALQGFS